MRANDQAQQLLQLVNDGFVFVDVDFRVLEINSADTQTTASFRSGFLGRILWEIAPDLRGSEVGRTWARAMRDRAPVTSEHFYTWSDGRQSWLETRAYPAPGGLAIFYRDVTARKRSEAELKHAQAELIHASRLSAMGTMAATLAHELAQPLTSAGTAIDASLRMLRSLPPAQMREPLRALQLAGAAVRRASEILKRLRAFVAKGQVRAETHDLQAIISDASVLAFPQAKLAGVEISFRLHPKAKWVRADAVQVQQVLINLIKNAMEALADAPERRITISTAIASAGEVEVTVEDTGPGLGAESAENLFTPFQTSKEGGLGLGLSISRTIIQAHGGTVEAGRSATGGALFRFTLPRASGPRAIQD